MKTRSGVEGGDLDFNTTADCPAGGAVSTGQTRRAELESVWCGGSSMRLAVVKPLDRRDIIAW